MPELPFTTGERVYQCVPHVGVQRGEVIAISAREVLVRWDLDPFPGATVQRVGQFGPQAAADELRCERDAPPYLRGGAQ